MTDIKTKKQVACEIEITEIYDVTPSTYKSRKVKVSLERFEARKEGRFLILPYSEGVVTEWHGNRGNQYYCPEIATDFKQVFVAKMSKSALDMDVDLLNSNDSEFNIFTKARFVRWANKKDLREI